MPFQKGNKIGGGNSNSGRPSAKDEFTREEMVIKAIGKWMKINGDSIYDTTASPFARLAWGRCTKIGKRDLK